MVICWPGVASAVEYLSPRWSCSANLLGVLWLYKSNTSRFFFFFFIFFFSFSTTMHLPRKKKRKNNEMTRRRIFILYYIHLWNAVPFLMCIYVCYIRIIREREREIAYRRVFFFFLHARCDSSAGRLIPPPPPPTLQHKTWNIFFFSLLYVREPTATVVYFLS